MIEILVALGIFTIAVGILGQIFSAVMRTQRVILVQQKFIEEGRNTIDILVDEIRKGTINYTLYKPPLASVLDTLKLVSRDGTLEFARSTNAVDCGFSGDVGCIVVRRGNGTMGVMTSSSVYIANLEFRIDPMLDPFTIHSGTLNYPVHIQPRVTIVLTLDSGDPAFRGGSPLTIQTTVTPRAYLR